MMSAWPYRLLAAAEGGLAVADVLRRQWWPLWGHLVVMLFILSFPVVRSQWIRVGVRSGYRRGWSDARSVMYGSLQEANKRGMTPREWLETELERDSGIVLERREPDAEERLRMLRERNDDDHPSEGLL